MGLTSGKKGAGNDPHKIVDFVGVPVKAATQNRRFTSKWNKVEHRLFSFISTNWRGEPLTDYETIVRLIARTTTATGLVVTCKLDRRKMELHHLTYLIRSVAIDLCLSLKLCFRSKLRDEGQASQLPYSLNNGKGAMGLPRLRLVLNEVEGLAMTGEIAMRCVT